MSRIVVLDRNGTSKQLEARDGDPLMWALRDAMLVEASCGGCASCGTCHIFVEAAQMEKLPKRASDETDMLESLSHFDAAKSRLSCQIKVTPALDGLELTVAPPE